jgi:hypothetical protein
MTRFNRINVAHSNPSLASQLLQEIAGFQMSKRDLLILPLLCFGSRSAAPFPEAKLVLPLKSYSAGARGGIIRLEPIDSNAEAKRSSAESS